MKVLQINAVYGSRSTGIIVKDIESAIQEEGGVSILCSPMLPDSANTLSVGNKYENLIHAIITRINGGQGFASWFSTRRLVSKLRRLDPDVIHLHNTHSNFLNLPQIFDYAREYRKPVVITFHDSWYFTGKCYHFLDIGCNKWKVQCHHCPKQRMEIPSIIDASKKNFRNKGRLYKGLNLHVVGCSKWITTCAQQSPLLRDASFHQIYNGIDTGVFRPLAGCNKREQFNLDGKFVMLSMANKWFDPQNEAMRASIIGSLTDQDILIIVGCSEYQSRMYNENDRILTIAFVNDREELAAYYRTADVFLNLTYVDTLPTVNMEAAACGTPVITHDAGGSAELVDDGRTGYVVSPGECDFMLNRIKCVKKGEIQRTDCVEWAHSRYEKHLNYKQYVELYKLICNEY